MLYSLAIAAALTDAFIVGCTHSILTPPMAGTFSGRTFLNAMIRPLDGWFYPAGYLS
jgi:hypothetical protein